MAKARSTNTQTVIDKVTIIATTVPGVAKILAVGVVYYMLGLHEWVAALTRLFTLVIESPEKYQVTFSEWTWGMLVILVTLPAGMLMGQTRIVCKHEHDPAPEAAPVDGA